MGNNTMNTMFGKRAGWVILEGPDRSLETSWRAAQCIRCGAQVFRKRGGDLDDWWVHDFKLGMDHHDEKECPFPLQ